MKLVALFFRTRRLSEMIGDVAVPRREQCAAQDDIALTFKLPSLDCEYFDKARRSAETDDIWSAHRSSSAARLNVNIQSVSSSRRKKFNIGRPSIVSRGQPSHA